MARGRFGTRVAFVLLLVTATTTVTTVAAAKPPRPAGTADVVLWGPWLWDDTMMVGSTNPASLTVENTGPDPATEVTLTHTPPSGLEVTDATASDGSCTIGRTVQCTWPRLAVSGQGQASISYRALTTGERTLSMSVSAREQDPDLTDNTGVASLSVVDSTPMPVSCDTESESWNTDNDSPSSCRVSFTLGHPTSIRLSLSAGTTAAGDFIAVLEGPRRIEWRRRVVLGEVVDGAEQVFDLEAGAWTMRLVSGDVLVDRWETLPGPTTPGIGPVRIFCTPMGCSTLSVPPVQIGGTRHVYARSAVGYGTITADVA